MNDFLELLLLTGRLIVGGLLIIAGLLKAQAGSHRFLRQLLAYELVKGMPAQLIAKGLPWLEVGCGLFLLLGLFLPIATVVTFALLGLFTSAIATAIVREKKVGCGCFGHSKSRLRWQLTYRNLVLMGLLALLLTPDVNQWTVDSWLFSSSLGFSALQPWLLATWAVALLTTVSLHLLVQPATSTTNTNASMK